MTDIDARPFLILSPSSSEWGGSELPEGDSSVDLLESPPASGGKVFTLSAVRARVMGLVYRWNLQDLNL